MESESTEVVTFVKKKNRLSQVVDKLVVGANDKENNNNNISECQMAATLPTNDAMRQLFNMTPQLASTVPQTQQVVQQTANIPQAFYLTQTPTVVDSEYAKMPPQIESTVPDLIPANTQVCSTILQKFLIHGGQAPVPPAFLPFDVWQRMFNIRPSKVLLNDAGPTTVTNVIKEEENEHESMVVDDVWNTNNNTFDLKSKDGMNVESNKEFDSFSQYRNAQTHFQTIPAQGQQNMFHLANLVPPTFQAMQPEAVANKYMSHIPISAIPTPTRKIKQKTYKAIPSEYNVPSSNFNSDLPFDLSIVKADEGSLKMEHKSKSLNGFTDSESETSSTTSLQSYLMNQNLIQDEPLDLSLKGKAIKKEHKQKCKSSKRGSREGKKSIEELVIPYPEVRGDVASPTTRETMAARYNMEVSPVVEQMPDGSDTAWACPVCGQLFSQKDRLAKHVACRHRGRSPSRTHVCLSCNRGFSRSDMLTRHLRLHTGQKPYSCGVCGQIFSRSDHLATHRRTHTGEKPYKCPQCSYSACRRDMITRHMRTHKTTSPTESPPSDQVTSSTSPIAAQPYN